MKTDPTSIVEKGLESLNTNIGAEGWSRNFEKITKIQARALTE